MEAGSDKNGCDKDLTEGQRKLLQVDNTELAYVKTLLPLTNHSKEECLRIVADVVQIFLRSSHDPEPRKEHLLETLKVLKSSCVKGVQFQQVLAKNGKLLDALDKFLACVDVELLYPVCVSATQLIANVCVSNAETQKLIWDRFKDRLLAGLDADAKLSNIWSMIAYNIRIHDTNHQLMDACLEDIFDRILRRISSGAELPEYFNLLLEYYITRGKQTVDFYPKLGEKEKIGLIYYIADFVKDERNKPVEATLFRRLLGEFKRKSDAILKPSGDDAKANPREVYGLLEVVAYSSCNPTYNEVLHKDSSLFINLGCVLTAVHKAGKEKNSIFTPIQKLDQVVPSSLEDAKHEQEISYSLKSLLVKAIGNLMYKNRSNQALVREMDILLTILECTNIDARNPMVKEYSILAIHNACDGNQPNQEFITSMSKVGDVTSPVVSEFMPNTIRIQKPERRSSTGFHYKRKKPRFAIKIRIVGSNSSSSMHRGGYEASDDDDDDDDDLLL